MLAKQFRLNLSLIENADLFANGLAETKSSKYFLLYSKPNDFHLRLSCVAPKGALAKAADRNDYRRFMYQVVEKSIKQQILSLQDKLDIAIVLKKHFNANKHLLAVDLEALIKKIHATNL